MKIEKIERVWEVSINKQKFRVEARVPDPVPAPNIMSYRCRAVVYQVKRASDKSLRLFELVDFPKIEETMPQDLLMRVAKLLTRRSKE